MANGDWIDAALREAHQKVASSGYAVYRFFCQIPGCPSRVRLREGELCSDPECSAVGIPHPDGWQVLERLTAPHQERVILAMVCSEHSEEEIEELMEWLRETDERKWPHLSR